MAVCNPVIPTNVGDAVPVRHEVPTPATPPATKAEQPSSPTAAAMLPPGSSHNTMLSAFAPAFNQATTAAGGDTGDAVAAIGDAQSTADSPPLRDEQPLPVLLWDHANQSGPAEVRSHTAHSLARVDEDMAALWWS